MTTDSTVPIRDLDWDTPRPVIFIHGDVEGMVTASIFLRGRSPGSEVRFTGARRLAGDLQALADRVDDGLHVEEVLIGNVPVRPQTIGAVRRLLASRVPVTWVDYHNTRQPLLDETADMEGLTFLHDTEPARSPCCLAAQVLDLEDDHVDRLIEVAAGHASEDAWVRDCHTLLSAQIGRAEVDVLRRLAADEALNDEDRTRIREHLDRERAADELVQEVDHPRLTVAGLDMVVIDARGRDVGYLPRRVEARYPDVDLRVVVQDDTTMLVTSSARHLDLVRLLRSLPWPAGVYVGGRPHQVRIDPGEIGAETALDILRDGASWPADPAAAASRTSRQGRNARAAAPPPRRSSRGPTRVIHVTAAAGAIRHRGFFERMVEQRVVADLMLDAWRDGERLDVLDTAADDAGYSLVLERGGLIRHVVLHATVSSEEVTEVAVALSLAERPAGCVIWAEVTDSPQGLDVGYRWFGGHPGDPAPPLDGFPSRRDDGPPFALLPRGAFTGVPSVHALSKRLFGEG